MPSKTYSVRLNPEGNEGLIEYLDRLKTTEGLLSATIKAALISYLSAEGDPDLGQIAADLNAVEGEMERITELINNIRTHMLTQARGIRRATGGEDE